MGVVLELVGVVLLVGAAFLSTVGFIGLLRKPDLFDQLHVAGLVTGPGVILVLLASVATGRAEIVTSALLVLGIVLVTGSISTHVIAQTGVRRYAPTSSEIEPRTGPPAVSDPADPGAAIGEVRRPASAGTGMRVLIAHDGTAAAGVASDLAATLDWPAGTRITILGVGEAEPPAVDGRPAADPVPGADVVDATDLARALDAAADAVRRPGLEVERRLVGGDPADAIVEAAARLDADLVITGNRRRGFVQSLLGRSVAGEIVDRAPCPVLVARTPRLREALLTTDGSAQSLLAAELVAGWPIFDLVRIRVVSVGPAGTEPGDGPRGAGARGAGQSSSADGTAALLMDAGREVVTEVLSGDAAERIVETAARRSIDLIVIGSRGRTGLGRTLMGSVTRQVLEGTSSSVLIVGPRPRRPPPA